MDDHQKIINRIFDSLGDDGFWKVIGSENTYYPSHLHYVPTYKASLWTLILLADIECPKDDTRAKKVLSEIQDHLFDENHGIYTLKEDHFPIPCLNGNMIYLDCYFNGFPNPKSIKALDYFANKQRFDDGVYDLPPCDLCRNKSCYGPHSCYWGVIKLLKGISFVPLAFRTDNIKSLLQKCIDFVLLHKVCYKSHKPEKIMIQKMDLLTFPNMYKADFLEILWLLKRENVKSNLLGPALNLLKSKQQPDGNWHLERKVYNMVTSVGQLNKPNPFITKRAEEVLAYYSIL
jgi:hypothetical protein